MQDSGRHDMRAFLQSEPAVRSAVFVVWMHHDASTRGTNMCKWCTDSSKSDNIVISWVMPFFRGWAWSKKRYTNGLVVHLSSAPLLWDGLILVQDVRRHVIQVLQSHAIHLACLKVLQCHRERAKKGYSWRLYQRIIQIASTPFKLNDAEWSGWMVRREIWITWYNIWWSGISSQDKL